MGICVHILVVLVQNIMRPIQMVRIEASLTRSCVPGDAMPFFAVVIDAKADVTNVREDGFTCVVNNLVSEHYFVVANVNNHVR